VPRSARRNIADIKRTSEEAFGVKRKKMKIKTDRLVLRPLTTEYLSEAHEFLGDLENTRSTKYFPTDSIEETREFLARCEAEWQKNLPTYHEFAVILDTSLVGKVSLYLSPDRSTGNIGWIFNKRFWGRGYAQEAATAVRDFAFEVLGIKKLVARCDYRNTSSITLVKKLGMQFEFEGVRQNRSSPEQIPEYNFAMENPKST